MNDVTIAQAFEIAIATEKAAERLFLGLETKFAYREDLAMFWKQHALDEADHAKWLEGLKAKLTEQQLSQPVEDRIVEMLQVVSGYSIEKALQGVRNLEDAYQLVNDIESGETNAIFEFLLNNFEKDDQMRDFLRAQLTHHMNRLSLELPEAYRGNETRRAILVQG